MRERYGLVWAFLGDLPAERRPPLSEWPELDEPSWRRIQGTFRWDAHVDRVVEGGLVLAPALTDPHRARAGPRRQLIFQAHLPIDDEHTLTHYIVLRDFARTPLFDQPFRWANLREDRRVVDALRPELLPFDLADELHIRADALQLAYRRRRRELIAGGWPTVGAAPTTGSTQVIGSPDRRDPAPARAWVHKPLP